MAIDQEILFQKNKNYRDSVSAAEQGLTHALGISADRAKYVVACLVDVASAKVEMDKANKEAKDDRVNS